MNTFEANKDIVEKGEILRLLYLTYELLEKLSNSNGVVEEMDIRAYLNCDNQLVYMITKLSHIISLAERNLPEWAVQLAKQTYRNREAGFVIWEPKKSDKYSGKKV